MDSLAGRLRADEQGWRAGPEPVEEIMAVVRKVKSERRHK